MRKNFLFCWTYALVIAIVFVSCNNNKDSTSQTGKQLFKNVEGIKFIEIRREFNTGLIFSKQGFQQIPEWELYFLPGDSVKIYSPFKKRYIHYRIFYDHAKVINFASEWLRLIHLNKDSLVLQLLEVQSQEVKKDLSNVYMRFYSEKYIRDVLHATPEELRKPKQRDTAYIRKAVRRANKFSRVPDSLFASRNPVQLKSKSKLINVSKKVLSKDDIDYSAAAEYLYPEYDILISEAYKDFSYSFTAIVDTSGKITVDKFAVLEKEFEAPRRKLLQGIVDVYLQRLMQVTPGETFGMPHATEIMLHVRGIK